MDQMQGLRHVVSSYIEISVLLFVIFCVLSM